jgi:cellobiose-specific phosphotransferase system component IIA
MTTIIKKGAGKKRLNEALQKIKKKKKFDANKHLGKVSWDEDALEYQKKHRNEWD